MSNASFRVPLLVEEPAGIARHRAYVRVGVPLPEGVLHDPTEVVVVDGTDLVLECQSSVLAQWADRSVRWLLVDFVTPLAPNARVPLTIRRKNSNDHVPAICPLRLIRSSDTDAYVVDTGVARFALGSDRRILIETAELAGEEMLGASGVAVQLTGCSGTVYTAMVQRLEVEEQGLLRGTIAAFGSFRSMDGADALEFKARCVFLAGESDVRIELLIRNPRAARHPGGLWDLGDQATVLFRDLTVHVEAARHARRMQWFAERSDATRNDTPGCWLLYQDSSGGENWDSENHVDAEGQSIVRFRGYRVIAGSDGQKRVIAEGDRANPGVEILADQTMIGVAVADFWQNFPKALRATPTTLNVGILPRESRMPHALQGGEQKRHNVFIEFRTARDGSSIAAWLHPPRVAIDPAWVEQTRTVLCFKPAIDDRNGQYQRYMNAIIDGPQAFTAKRERIDEYGWRNFGDLYADHESVCHRGVRPLVSHYNNQYDFVHGALVHYLRTGDARWWRLGDEAARHTIDIDIYHTDEDRAAFNHGLFWHTDHHLPAATCTHRTYSVRNDRSPAYGGGPSNEHNYTSGLLLYHYLSGDPEAGNAVRELADWVIAMDDGSRGALGLVDPGPTGLASKTVDDEYHKAGRGAGNSINALLDAYQLCGDRPYLDKAEELIRRCIHPHDDVAALSLGEPEFRWSYLVFLQVLGKYLYLKLEWHESDYMLHYARASLLHYARWMLAREVPYKEVLDRVELPTETWPAHDIRKAHVLNVAAHFAPRREHAAFRARARFFFDRCLDDVLSFETAYLTRPLVILCGNGYVQAYYDSDADALTVPEPLAYAYGKPAEFESQKRRWRRTLPSRILRLAKKLGRAGVERIGLRRRYTTPLRL